MPDQRDVDLLLDRTLSTVRGERARSDRRRGSVVVTGAVVLCASALVSGVALGRTAAAPHVPLVLEGTTTGGVHVTAVVTPAEGWVRLAATVDGVPDGERCRLVVTTRTGQRHVAGNWVASPEGARGDTALAGAALVDVADLGAVSVVTVDGRVLVSTTG
ncbi:hypothetical protein [Umezawaea beigongshangensis]|uniref:hypothetical protein n=1 Tax=Umezawaea beigongshangensis TaxID=2780383 RepID=UPI0018F1FDCA|nr:hypothetical protein [Umezawaea beigongshangensis]